MPINEEGRQQLIKMLRASIADTNINEFPRYNQNDFGDQSCGTVCCLAGFALYKQIGPEAWTKAAIEDPRQIFHTKCKKAGIEFLGLKNYDTSKHIVEIFNFIGTWPNDLYERYKTATKQAERVEVAIEALIRLNENGSIKKLEKEQEQDDAS